MAPRDSFRSQLYSRSHGVWKWLRSISFSSWLTRLIWVVIVAAVPASIWALIYIPNWQVGRVLSEGASARAVFELENEARRTMAQIVLGVFGLLALFVTWRRTRAAEKAVEVAESGQQTERFTKAIEQLGATDDKGNPRLEIRLGGIYALERLARDSEDQDYWTILEVLTAYVRQNAGRAADRESPRIDIQTILTVLGRRDTAVRNKGRLDLGSTWLRRVRLANGSFQAGIFVDCVMEQALLVGTDLTRALLIGANLFRADIHDARLTGAILDRANLLQTNFRGTHLERASLIDAALSEADLTGAHMDRAVLIGANLLRADLVRTSLLNADLTNANLAEAILMGASVSGANFAGANVSGADLSECDISAEQLGAAHGDSTTRLPKGISAPDSWLR